MKKNLIRNFVIAGIFLVFTAFAIDQLFFPQLPQRIINIKRQNAETLNYQLEIARTPNQQQRGLMYRLYLPEYHGMIFTFNPPQQAKFWMKNTFIPLDILFVDSNDKIIWIEHSATPHDLTPRGPEDPVKVVIELPGGTAKKENIQIGDLCGVPDDVVSFDLWGHAPHVFWGCTLL